MNDSKICFKCLIIKDLNEFYKHPLMPDGHVNKCKECNKKDVSEHRLKNIDKVRAYDKKRGCRLTKDELKKYRQKYPKKYKAHQIVNYAIKSKKLFNQPCEICGKNETHGHHDDYDKPLNVRWLCAEHHHQWHAKHGEALNSI